MVFTHRPTIDHRTWNPQLGFADGSHVLIYDVRGHPSPGLAVSSNLPALSEISPR